MFWLNDSLNSNVSLNNNSNWSRDEELLLNNPDILWIAQLTSTINLNDIEFEKGNLEDFKNIYFEKLRRNELTLYDVYANGDSPKLSFTNFLHPGIDSIFVFDPGNYEERLIVRKYPPLSVEDISKVRITQLFCFNNESSSFTSSVQSVNVLRDHEGASFELFMIK